MVRPNRMFIRLISKNGIPKASHSFKMIHLTNENITKSLLSNMIDPLKKNVGKKLTEAEGEALLVQALATKRYTNKKAWIECIDIL